MVIPMQWLAAAVLLAVLPVAAQGIPDPQRGMALYENHCQVCHTSRVHSRINKLPINHAELRAIVEHWQREEGLRWTAQEIDDVVDFLNLTRYGYAPGR